MKKVCTVCRVERDFSEFGTNNRMKDEKHYVCKECISKRSHDYYKNRTPKQNANKIYSGIKKRCENEKYHELRPKYKNVKNLLDKDEFIRWYVENYFDGCEVDRVKDDGHYEMSNIQLLSKEEHNRKRKIERDGYVKEGFKKCNRCKVKKPNTKKFFSPHKRNISEFNPLGLRGICKECLNIQRREYYKKKKETTCSNM